MLSNNKNLIFIFLIPLLLVALVTVFYFFFLNPREKVTDFYQFDVKTQEFKKVIGVPADPTILDVDSTGDTHLGKILKGYFHQFDSKSNTLEIKNEFLGSSYLQVLPVSLQPLTSFYCWPETVSSENSTIETKEMQFYVYPNGQDIVMPGERYFTLDLLEDFLKNSDQYLIIQLKDIYRLNVDNQVQKLILLGC